MTEPAKITDLMAKLRSVQARQRHAEPVDVPDVDPLSESERVAYMAERRAERWAAVVPRRFVPASIDGVSDPHAAALRVWLETSPAPNLVMFGPVGVGKTWAACAAVRPLIEAGVDGLIVSVPKLLDMIRGGMNPGGDPHVVERAERVGVLVLDDIGAERATDWTGERLMQIIDQRHAAERPVVATSNLDPKALRAAVGDRCYSRLVGGATVVRFAGGDRRARS